jgi:biopolymer transport protein ExbD
MRVDLLPLIDVVFLLLAILLLAMVRMVRSWTLPIDLPGVASGEAVEAPTILLISLDASGTRFVGGEAIPRGALADRVRSSIAGDPELAVLVQADRDARHGDVTELLDELRTAGASRVMFVAAPLAPPSQPSASEPSPDSRLPDIRVR